MALTLKNIAILAGIFLVSVYWVSGFFGVSGIVPALLITAAITGVGSWMKWFNPFKLNARGAQTVFVIGLIGTGLFAGWFSAFGLTPDSFGLGPAAPAMQPLVPFAPTAPATMDACKAGISEYLVGKKATVTFNAFDAEAANPYSAAVDSTIFIVKNGDVVTSADTTAYDMATYSVGDVISVYGKASSGATYYVDDKTDICITSEAFPIDLKARAIVAIANLQVTCYDDTGSASCSGGTNTSQEDYDITLGASEETTFFARVKVNAANKAHSLMGLAVLTTNDIDTVKPTGSEWTAVTVPDYLNVQVSPDGSLGENITGGYEKAWVLSAPVMLHQWDWVKYQFKIESGSTDPATATTFQGSDNAIVCFLDGGRTRGDDGKLYFDIKTHTDTEANVGLVENFTYPVSGDSCMAIEGI